MDFRWLGTVSYADGLALQNELVEQRHRGEIGDTVLLLEHEPVYTIGRTRDQTSLRDPGDLPHPVFEINRGGQATYHGPGQLVGYLILDLNVHGRDLHDYLRRIESFLIAFAGHFGMEAGRREGLTGVWVEDRKLASIGVGVRKWISMHGFGPERVERPLRLRGHHPLRYCQRHDDIPLQRKRTRNHGRRGRARHRTMPPRSFRARGDGMIRPR
jgi:lipoyl(octanoyl) transferase